MSECAEYLMALTEDSSDVLPEKQKELVLRRDESTRVEVKIGPASVEQFISRTNASCNDTCVYDIPETFGCGE